MCSETRCTIGSLELQLLNYANIYLQIFLGLRVLIAFTNNKKYFQLLEFYWISLNQYFCVIRFLKFSVYNWSGFFSFLVDFEF